MTTPNTRQVTHKAGPGFDYFGRWIGRCKLCKTVHSIEEYEGDPIGTYRNTTCCGRTVRLEQVLGTTSDKKTCGSRCVNAVGPSCDCSCGGENHGQGWA